MRRVARRTIRATLLASSIAACNALTGASDLTPCDDCGDGIAQPDATSDGTPGADGRVTPVGADAAVDGATVDATRNDAADAGDAADAAPVGCQGAVDCTRVVFVTSATYTGNLGGIAGADAKCQALADASPNPRIKDHTFQAWVSTITIPVSARFTHGSQPYVLGDATVIASDWADLTDGSLASGISLDELGQAHDNANAWTATTSNGANYANAGCESWTNATNGSAIFGNVGGTGLGWSSSGLQACPASNLLYCFEK